MRIPDDVKALIDAGALVVINHSGGKDSQAMTLVVEELVRLGQIKRSQVVAVHAELPGVDWPGLESHIRDTCAFPLHLVRAGKTFFEMVERRHAKDANRPCWPSPQFRQCTSDLKRGPIDTWTRRYLKAHPEHNGAVVHLIGVRAQESAQRAKQPVTAINKRESKAGRYVMSWHPIHAFSEAEVWDWIHGAGQEGHWAYLEGMSRLSCSFCIMGSRSDLRTAARLRPELLAQYDALEELTGYTMIDGARLVDLCKS